MFSKIAAREKKKSGVMEVFFFPDRGTFGHMEEKRGVFFKAFCNVKKGGNMLKRQRKI